MKGSLRSIGIGTRSVLPMNGPSLHCGFVVFAFSVVLVWVYLELQDPHQIFAALVSTSKRDGVSKGINDGGGVQGRNPQQQQRYCKEGDSLYFLMNPDILSSVKDGKFKSGFDHWEKYGQFEGREYSCNNLESETASAPVEGSNKSTSPSVTNSATGKLINNRQIRTFTGKRVISRNTAMAEEHSPPMQNDSFSNRCERWGVVTTIFDPTAAITRVRNLPNWCLVVVPDLKTPYDYMEKLNKLQKQEKDFKGKLVDNVFYFSHKEQQEWAAENGALGAFVKSTPWNHFARKNLGYLFAILHGAKFIFDFDDDNFIKVDNAGMPVEILPEGKDLKQMKLNDVVVAMLGSNAFNHHTMMGASVQGSWARGFPLELINDKSTQGEVAFETELPFATNDKEIGVIQFVADGNPDLDAIHRMTKPLPMTFAVNDSGRSVLVPVHAYSPYNAQATIHTKNAFWAMLLPRTVPGRVSDIWRSYFAQCIFADAGLRLVFAPPKVVQERNPHNYLADFSAEQDLYNKAGQLISYLNEWDSSSDSIPERMEELWISLYERGYIELQDVQSVQLWLGTLIQAGYKFPPLKRRYRNVALMGQFNYAHQKSTVSDVIYWTQKNREFFHTVIAAGPFSSTQMEKFEANSIAAVSNNIDQQAIVKCMVQHCSGYFSPLDNLKNMLLAFKTSSRIKGVFYAHDDGILNHTEITKGEFPFPTDKIIWNRSGTSNPMINTRTLSDNEKVQIPYRIFPDGHTESVEKSKSFESAVDMYKKLPMTKWGHFDKVYCTGGQTALAKDPASQKYRESDGSILFPHRVQSDFMFVPTVYADEFAEAAELHLKHKIWIECAFPKVFDMVREKAGAQLRTVNLCTSWGGDRGSEDMIMKCIHNDQPMGFIHPFKISKGYKLFSKVYDQVQ